MEAMKDVNNDNVTYSPSKVQKEEEHLVIDLGSIDTQGLLHEGEHKHTLKHASKLSAREMESLTALCDTFIPAIDPPDSSTADEAVARFYRTSGSMAGTPEYVGGLITQRLGHHVFLLRVFLISISTGIGTFVFGGLNTLSPSFPFFQKFSQLSPEKRQQFLLSLSSSWFGLYRQAFYGLKILISLAFFTQVNEKEENVSWKAIGYDGPDPNFISQKRSKMQNQSNPQVSYLTTKPTKGPNEEKDQNQPKDSPNKEDLLYDPLYKGIINAKSPRRIIIDSLRSSGFHVSVNNKKSKKQKPALTIRCDAVVAGSGSGGGVVAGILASAGYKVIVIEKGEYFSRNNLSLLEGPTFDQMYEGAGLVSTRDVGVTILAGSTVGGGSTVNWSASIRTPPHVLRDWAGKHGLEIFQSPLYEEALNTVCQKMEVQSEVDDEGFNNAVLRKGCLELGYPVQDIPRNAPSDHYCGWCFLGCKDGKKKGISETWLKDLVQSGNGAILTGCQVHKVLLHKGRERNAAFGVALELNGEFCIVESKATIVACGALNTPPLLKKSGLKNPNIGKNLHLHPVVLAWGYFPEDDDTSWPAKRSYEGGIMTAMSTVVGNFETTGYGAVIQTPSLHPGLFGVVTPWTSGLDYKNRMRRFSRTATVFALARDVGTGAVYSANDLEYKLHPVDEGNLKKGVEKLLRILAAAGAEEVGTHHRGGPKLNVKKSSYHEFEDFVTRESSRSVKVLSYPIASAHQMGSCKMGVNPKDSVVNQMGETWEVEDLYLADTSVFPTALGVNPMVTVQAIAYCTAQSVLESLKRKKKR